MKRAIVFTPRDKFVSNITDVIFDDNTPVNMKNSLLGKGTTIFTLYIKDIRNEYGDTFIKSLLVVLLRVFSILWFLNFTGALIAANTMKQTIAVLLLQHIPFHAGLQISNLISSGSTKYVGGAYAETNHMNKSNKYFKLKWGNGSTFFNVLTDNIAASTLEMKVYPKFKIK